MLILSRISRRVREDGVSGLLTALYHRIVSPLHVMIVSYDGTYLVKRGDVVVDIASTRLQPLLKYRMRIGFLDYEAAESDAISSHLDPDMDVIELGAGIGFISCVIDQKLSDKPSHIAVEANPELIQTIDQNRKRNDADFKIKHAVYSPIKDKVSLNVYDDFRSSGIYNKSGKAKKEVTVGGINLADLVEDHNIERFTLVADIEGAEANLILEEWEIIQKYCDTLILEFHSRNPDTPRAKSKLSGSNFNQVYKNLDVEVWSS